MAAYIYTLLREAMPYDTTINFSDVEMSPPPPNLFATAGQSSITEIIDNAIQDRFSSKKEVRNLTLTSGRPHQQSQRSL